ncbi:hypothetical protein [Marinobacter sp. JSM 1782161]|uniref:hypothetical protein n=1 Tax=Marinobacter sp. JSM 1782161 TaxID=2685906 RepID=UPI001402F4CF|nr:hypothetical protein [Marinobacter sp. JSM 1782161]
MPSSIRFRKRALTRLLLTTCLTLTPALLMTACGGGGDDAVEEASQRPNSFPGTKNPADGFSESSTGDSNNANGLAKNEVRITLEVPSLLAPSAPRSRRNLRLVQPDQVRVYRTDHTLNPLSSTDTRTRQDDDGFTVIAFTDGQPVGPDVLIEAEYGGTTLRAFATDRDRDVKVNPFSEYLVRHGLGGYNAAEFATVMDCVESTDSDGLCINKFVWSTLADQVQDFEIDIPDGTDLEGALAQLHSRADFAGYVADMAGLAQVAPTSTSAISADSVTMNSVYFGLELGRSSRFSDTPAAQWATQRAYEERIENGGVAYIYPALSLSSLAVFDINVTSMAGDVPYERSTVTRFGDGDFDARGRSFWGINSHATSPSAASIVDRDRLLAGQSLYQSITDRNSAMPVGWTRNPFFLDAHILLSDDYPDSLLSARFSGGKAIELERDGEDYQRLETLEAYYLSAFDISLAQSEAFDVATLKDDYNVVSFSAELGDVTQPFRVESLVGTWSGTGPGDYTQAADARSLHRNASGAVGMSAPDRSDTAHVGRIESQLSAGDVYNGRLALLYDGISGSIRNQEGLGASNPQASLLAFNLDNPTHGEGLLLALEPGSGGPAEASYRLNGTLVGLGGDAQFLHHIDDGVLSITSVADAEAVVVLKGFQVSETISSAQLQPPTRLEAGNMPLTYTASADRLTFSSGDGSLVLDGFISSDREFVVLRLHQTLPGGEAFLGLLLGARNDG